MPSPEELCESVECSVSLLLIRIFPPRLATIGVRHDARNDLNRRQIEQLIRTVERRQAFLSRLVARKEAKQFPKRRPVVRPCCQGLHGDGGTGGVPRPFRREVVEQLSAPVI